MGSTVRCGREARGRARARRLRAGRRGCAFPLPSLPAPGRGLVPSGAWVPAARVVLRGFRSRESHGRGGRGGAAGRAAVGPEDSEAAALWTGLGPPLKEPVAVRCPPVGVPPGPGSAPFAGRCPAFSEMEGQGDPVFTHARDPLWRPCSADNGRVRGGCLGGGRPPTGPKEPGGSPKKPSASGWLGAPLWAVSPGAPAMALGGNGEAWARDGQWVRRHRASFLGCARALGAGQGHMLSTQTHRGQPGPLPTGAGGQAALEALQTPPTQSALLLAVGIRGLCWRPRAAGGRSRPSRRPGVGRAQRAGVHADLSPQQLKQQRDKLRQYQRRVTQQLERERDLARQLLRAGRKE